MLQTDIEKARVAWYTTHPEAVIKSESKMVAVCHRCHGKIPLDHQCLFESTFSRLPGCPHCLWACSASPTIDGYHHKPIPHSIYKVVKHYTKLPKKKWFSVEEGEWFEEFVYVRSVPDDANPPHLTTGVSEQLQSQHALEDV